MRVVFNTVYDERVIITNVEAVTDAPDALVVTAKLGDNLKLFVNGTEDCTPMIYADHIAIPKECISKEITCSA